MAKMKNLTWKQRAGIGIGIIVILYCCVAFYYSKGFVFGTKINGENVSGMTEEEVIRLFQNKAENYSLTLKERKGKKEVLTEDQIRAKFEGADEIRKIAKEQSSLLWIKGLFGGETYDDVTMFSYDENSFETAYQKLECMDEKKIVKRENAKPVYKDGKFVIQKEEKGTELDLEQTEKKIKECISGGVDQLDLEKEKCYYDPQYTSESEEISDLKKEMNKVLKGSITYKFGKQKVVLDKSVYHKWMKIGKDGISYEIDENTMENWILDFIYKYNTQYGWHTFKTHDGRTKKIFGGPYGWRISKDKEMEAVKKMLKEGTTETREPYWRQKGKVYDGINGDIGDTYAEVDMSAQMVYYYKDGKQVFSTPCVTGMMTADRKTPECVAYIMYKERSATLVGENYSSPVKYCMPFVGNVGFHSASWRNSFGGSIYINSGSHGCVNLPESAAQKLYSLVETGDPVVTYY